MVGDEMAAKIGQCLGVDVTRESGIDDISTNPSVTQPDLIFLLKHFLPLY